MRMRTACAQCAAAVPRADARAAICSPRPSVAAVFFPSSILTLAGGAIFGFWGIPLVWVSATVGQTLAFFLSRYLLRSWVAGWSERYKVWQAVEAAVREQGFKIVTLLRLATIVPYSATNALLPITSVSVRLTPAHSGRAMRRSAVSSVPMTLLRRVQFWQYTLGSAIGIVPGVCLYTMIGRLASSIAEVVNGDVDTNPVILIVSIVVSIIVLVVVVVLLTRYAKKALREQLEAEAVATGAADSSELPEPSPSASASSPKSLHPGRAVDEPWAAPDASRLSDPSRSGAVGTLAPARGRTRENVAVALPAAR